MTVAPGSDILAQDIISGVCWYAADAGSTDTYAISLPTAPSSYTAGLHIRFKANTTNTGASTLNVNSLGAIAIVKNVNQPLDDGDIMAGQIVEVIYLSSAFHLVSRNNDLKYPTQDLRILINSATQTVTTGAACKFTSNPSGSVVFMTEDINNDGTAGIYRYEKDPLSGSYKQTHSTTLSTVTSGAIRGIAVVGSLLYVSTLVSGANALRRYSTTDLSGVTTVTFSGTSRAAGMWSDGTNLYIENGTIDQYDKFTISGTVATNAGAITYTSSNAGSSRGNICDGNFVWLSTTGGATDTCIVKRYAITGGAAVSTATFALRNDADYNGSGEPSFIMGNSGVLGIVWVYNTTSATAITGIIIHFYGITLP